MQFEDLNLNKTLLNALNDLGYIYPTPIQKETFSVLMSGKDAVGIAQTGTGKTLAYLLPLLRLHKFSSDLAPKILIIVPTRELVVQVVEESKQLSQYMNFRAAGVYGGTNINTQAKVVREGLDLLVATPGRLLDMALNGILRMKYIKKLVIDEVDEMFNLGFRPQLIRILDLLPKKRQNIMFSATLSPEHEVVIERYFNYPQKIEIAPHGTPLERIEQLAYPANNFNTKTNLLAHILVPEEMNKVLVFVANKKRADLLESRLSAIFETGIGLIHANKSQNYRLNSLAQFREGTHRVLIATDIMARGLDINGVSHVINFDLPETPGDYLHRIGRTGRAEHDGIAISLISEVEEEYQMAIEALMDLKITTLPFPEEVEVSTTLILEEETRLGGDKNYLKLPSMNSQGAFHEKKEKNKKVNRANEKRQARLLEKKRSGRKKKKK